MQPRRVSSNPTDLDKERWKFTLEEYVQTKQENLASIRSMQITLQIGLTALSLLIAGTVSAWSDPLAPALLLFAVPTVCLLVTRLWAAEVMRLARASYFLWRLEISLEQDFASRAPRSSIEDTEFSGHGPLKWEGWVRGKNSWGTNLLMSRSYKTILNFIAAVAFTSIVAGVVKVLEHVSLGDSWAMGILGGAWVVGAITLILRETLRTWSEISMFAEGATTE